MGLEGNIVLIWVCYSSPFTERSKMLLVLRGAQKLKSLQVIQAALQGAQQIQWCLMSVADRDAVWGLRQGPVGDLQHRLLRY